MRRGSESWEDPEEQCSRLRDSRAEDRGWKGAWCFIYGEVKVKVAREGGEEGRGEEAEGVEANPTRPVG